MVFAFGAILHGKGQLVAPLGSCSGLSDLDYFFFKPM